MKHSLKLAALVSFAVVGTAFARNPMSQEPRNHEIVNETGHNIRVSQLGVNPIAPGQQVEVAPKSKGVINVIKGKRARGFVAYDMDAKQTLGEAIVAHSERGHRFMVTVKGKGDVQAKSMGQMPMQAERVRHGKYGKEEKMEEHKHMRHHMHEGKRLKRTNKTKVIKTAPGKYEKTTTTMVEQQ